MFDFRGKSGHALLTVLKCPLMTQSGHYFGLLPFSPIALKIGFFINSYRVEAWRMRCVLLPFTHFYGLVIVPVLAMMLAFPAIAQISSNSSDPGHQFRDPRHRRHPHQHRQIQTKMTVSLDGVEKYVWPVSTGQAGYSTPSGTYTATSMNEIWYSKEWDDAPMPHSVFFRKDGYAIHGTYEAKNLGRPASHGCVRISRENAATLFALVKKVGLKNTEVVLTGVTPGGEYKVARPEEPRYGQAGPGWYQSDNYYAQPQWGGGFSGARQRPLLQWISGLLQSATTARILKGSRACSRCPLTALSGHFTSMDLLLVTIYGQG